MCTQGLYDCIVEQELLEEHQNSTAVLHVDAKLDATACQEEMFDKLRRAMPHLVIYDLSLHSANGLAEQHVFNSMVSECYFSCECSFTSECSSCGA